MIFFENLEKAKQLIDSLYEEGVAMLNKQTSHTPRKDILAVVRQWIVNGDLVLRIGQGNRTDVANAIRRGKLFPTSFERILATSEIVRAAFEGYIDSNRIFDCTRLAARKGLTTGYAIEKACESGVITKIEDFGSKAVIYVD